MLLVVCSVGLANIKIFIDENVQTLPIGFVNSTIIKLLNLWNDFRKVVEFIDENQWVKPMLRKNCE